MADPVTRTPEQSRKLWHPTTEEVRTEWIESSGPHKTPRLHAGAAFDRWLAAHDAEVAAAAVRQAQTEDAALVRAMYPGVRLNGKGDWDDGVHDEGLLTARDEAVQAIEQNRDKEGN